MPLAKKHALLRRGSRETPSGWSQGESSQKSRRVSSSIFPNCFPTTQKCCGARERESLARVGSSECACRITSIAQWVQAFAAFAAVKVSGRPSRALGYIRLVVRKGGRGGGERNAARESLWGFSATTRSSKGGSGATLVEILRQIYNEIAAIFKGALRRFLNLYYY